MQLSYLTAVVNNDRHAVVWVRAAALVVCWHFASIANAKAPSDEVPAFELATQAIDSYFATLPDYQAGDLICRSQIEAALATIEAAGWKVKDADAIAKLGLADNSFLVRELSSPTGRKFMRRVSRQQGVYSRLDRLSTIARGQKTVHDLIHQPGGDELVTYLTTTKGGHNMGRMMAGAQHGVDLNKPTGRIYTADDLVAELEKRSSR